MLGVGHSIFSIWIPTPSALRATHEMTHDPSDFKPLGACSTVDLIHTFGDAERWQRGLSIALDDVILIFRSSFFPMISALSMYIIHSISPLSITTGCIINPKCTICQMIDIDN
jgi:hypothetical protein